MKKSSRSRSTMPQSQSQSQSMPLVITLNCIEDTTLESDCLSGVAVVEHVSLSHLAEARIESAAAVLLHSLAFLPRAAQRLLRPSQLILCLGSSDRAGDSALAADLGLNRLVHVDVSRGEEVADTVMALVLGLLRRTHLLSRHALSASGWLGSVQPLCRGMRRCRGLVLGIVGRSASAKYLAARSLAFRMSVLYFDIEQGNERISRSSVGFPPAARGMDTLNDLLAASDIISLHCALTNETLQIINADCLQHVKPGAFLVNTGSSQLLDDCALKQLLIDGTLAGCAIDGAEGPQWMEAWVREMPNVLILPRSADYSEEVWMEIREKAVTMLQSFFVDGVMPKDAVSDEEEEESEINYESEQREALETERSLQSAVGQQQLIEDVRLTADSPETKVSDKSNVSPSPIMQQNDSSRTETKRSRSTKKSKRRHARQKSQQKTDGHHLNFEKESTSHHEDDAAMSGTDQVLNSNSRFASPAEDIKSRKEGAESTPESSSSKRQLNSPSMEEEHNNQISSKQLKDGCIIALHARDHHHAFHVSRQRVSGGGWFLDTARNVTTRDPAAQFLVVFRSKDSIGLRSLTAGGKLLQINRRMEFVFASHSFDVWESWNFEGSLEECRLVNCRNPLAVLDVEIEILAAVGDDGITRWLDD